MNALTLIAAVVTILSLSFIAIRVIRLIVSIRKMKEKNATITVESKSGKRIEFNSKQITPESARELSDSIHELLHC